VTEVAIAYPHVAKEKELIEFFKSRGYNCIDISYHHNLPKDSCNQLRKSDTPTSLMYRTMPDFLVCTPSTSFYAELKVGSSTRNAYLEAFPLAISRLRETSLGLRCVYVYAGVISQGRMVACYSSDIKPSKLVIPKRNKQIKDLLLNLFPSCPVQEREPSRCDVSGDAFVMIPKEQILQWEPLDLFIKKMAHA
jgi:hypothetical protein